MGLDFVSDINEGYKSAMNYDSVDKFMVKVGWMHLIVISMLLFTNSFLKLARHFPGPFSYRVLSITEVLVVFSIGLLATLFMALARGKFNNHYTWRIMVTVVFTIYAYLLVFLSGGSIEMHFHFFIIAALLCIYSDWRLGWIVLVLTGLHHLILNYVAPGWVYSYGRNDFSIIAHALPVIVIVIFTSIISENSRKSIISIMLKQKSEQK